MFSDDDAKNMVITLIFIGVIAGIFLTIALPVVWDLIKPFLHAITE